MEGTRPVPHKYPDLSVTGKSYLSNMIAITLISVIAAASATKYLDPTHVRIVGGAEASENEWPWQVSLQAQPYSFFPWSHFCGGSLIAPNYVLTAAHCVDGQRARNIRAVAGLHRQSDTTTSQALAVNRIIMHPDYNGNGAGFPNDIALLELSGEVTSNRAEIIGLARGTSSFIGNPDCWITGWGKTSANSGTAEVLMEAQMDVIDNGNCADQWRAVSGASIFDTHICIEAEGRSACNGDSGGPLVCKDNGAYVLAGATSWGITTCEGFPSVYVRVSKYLDWINANMA
ncbi:fibrinolytic enzyme, isozyme C [Magallana gigas]|uniref:Peptidase S1 domain-containing protein n=1 Tax=Magallana gigas TaxID=29159 RepID=A0A8W8KNN4_MAGGI|nr:fibrinolytic enzyme, isozyme C [Crassostrea gigas]|eukprot:XP_011413121.1 PREDICTED: fibrinolytic enzyme, isozyme C [Crassostrea gigas]